MTFHHVLEYVPDDRILTVHDLLCGLDRLHDSALYELADDERLVELGSHILRQTALVHIQLRTYDDDGTCGVIDTLSEEVLTETALLAFERVGQGLESPVGLALDGVGLLGVVEQGVHGFLKHSLLVAQYDFRRLDLDESLQTVVPDDHPSVEVVQV